jgi:hypothetical protein
MAHNKAREQFTGGIGIQSATPTEGRAYLAFDSNVFKLSVENQSKPTTMYLMNERGGAGAFTLDIKGTLLNNGAALVTDAAPWVARGDIIYYDGSAVTRLPLGNEDDALIVTDTGAGVLLPQWCPSAHVGTTTGDTIYFSGPGYGRVPIGANGTVYKVNAGVPSWQTDQGALVNVLTTDGDVLYYYDNAYRRLAKGNIGQILTMDAGQLPVWANNAGSGTSAPDVLTTKGDLTSYNSGYVRIAAPDGAVAANNGMFLTFDQASTDMPVWTQGLTTRGDLLTRDASNYTRVAKGTSGHILTAGASDFSWAANTGGTLRTELTNNGDILSYVSGTATRLPAGTANYVLRAAGANTNVGWSEDVALRLTTGGDFLYHNGSTQTRFPKGTTRYMLAMDAAGTPMPEWVPGMTTAGDLLTHNSTTTVRLPRGTANQMLQVNAGETALEWAASPKSLMTSGGDMLYNNAGTLARLPVGTARYMIASNAAGTAPEWVAGMTTAGDLLTHNSTTTVRLPKGTALQTLRVNAGATALEWATPSSGGTVQPSGATFYNIRAANEGVSVSGNARGEYSVDLQVDRSSATMVASGFNSALVGGKNNTASGDYSCAFAGQTNTASGLNAAVVGGYSCTASGQSSFALGSGSVTCSGAGAVAIGVDSALTFAGDNNVAMTCATGSGIVANYKKGVLGAAYGSSCTRTGASANPTVEAWALLASKSSVLDCSGTAVAASSALGLFATTSATLTTATYAVTSCAIVGGASNALNSTSASGAVANSVIIGGSSNSVTATHSGDVIAASFTSTITGCSYSSIISSYFAVAEQNVSYSSVIACYDSDGATATKKCGFIDDAGATGSVGRACLIAGCQDSYMEFDHATATTSYANAIVGSVDSSIRMSNGSSYGNVILGGALHDITNGSGQTVGNAIVGGSTHTITNAVDNAVIVGGYLCTVGATAYGAAIVASNGATVSSTYATAISTNTATAVASGADYAVAIGKNASVASGHDNAITVNASTNTNTTAAANQLTLQGEPVLIGTSDSDFTRYDDGGWVAKADFTERSTAGTMKEFPDAVMILTGGGPFAYTAAAVSLLDNYLTANGMIMWQTVINRSGGTITLTEVTGASTVKFYSVAATVGNYSLTSGTYCRLMYYRRSSTAIEVYVFPA